MASGHYPLDPSRDTGKLLAAISDNLKTLLDSVGDDAYANVPNCLPDPCDNDQYDNAASDGAYLGRLRLAYRLIEECLDRALPSPQVKP